MNHVCTSRHAQIQFKVTRLKVSVKATTGVNKDEELYLNYACRREGEGYYTKPLDDAYDATVLVNSIDGDPSELYPGNSDSLKVLCCSSS